MYTETLNGFDLMFTEQINTTECGIYEGMGLKGAITREKLGAALGYVDPQVAIGKIHKRHEARLDTRSTFTKLVNVDGKEREVWVP